MGFSQGFGPPKHKSFFFCLPKGTASPHRTNTAPAPSSAGHLKRLNQLISVLPIFRQTHLDHLPNGPNNEANPIINHDCWYMLISFKGYIYIYHVILYAQTSNKDWFDLVWPRSIFMFFWGWKIRLPCRRVNGNVLLVMSVLCCPPRPRSLCPHPIPMACVLLQGSLVFVACCRNVFASIALLHDLTLRRVTKKFLNQPVFTSTNFNIKPSHQAALHRLGLRNMGSLWQLGPSGGRMPAGLPEAIKWSRQTTSEIGGIRCVPCMLHDPSYLQKLFWARHSCPSQSLRSLHSQHSLHSQDSLHSRHSLQGHAVGWFLCCSQRFSDFFVKCWCSTKCIW